MSLSSQPQTQRHDDRQGATPLPVIDLDSIFTRDLPLPPPPPVMGLVTTDDLDLPFSLDHTDPILQQQQQPVQLPQERSTKHSQGPQYSNSFGPPAQHLPPSGNVASLSSNNTPSAVSSAVAATHAAFIPPQSESKNRPTSMSATLNDAASLARPVLVASTVRPYENGNGSGRTGVEPLPWRQQLATNSRLAPPTTHRLGPPATHASTPRLHGNSNEIRWPSLSAGHAGVTPFPWRQTQATNAGWKPPTNSRWGPPVRSSSSEAAQQFPNRSAPPQQVRVESPRSTKPSAQTEVVRMRSEDVHLDETLNTVPLNRSIGRPVKGSPDVIAAQETAGSVAGNLSSQPDDKIMIFSSNSSQDTQAKNVTPMNMSSNNTIGRQLVDTSDLQVPNNDVTARDDSVKSVVRASTTEPEDESMDISDDSSCEQPAISIVDAMVKRSGNEEPKMSRDYSSSEGNAEGTRGERKRNRQVLRSSWALTSNEIAMEEKHAQSLQDKNGPNATRRNDSASDSNEIAVTSNEKDDSNSSLATPPLSDSPQNVPDISSDEERWLMWHVDEMIIAAEEKELMEKIDQSILAAEEQDLLNRINHSIMMATERVRARGSRVLYVAKSMPDGSLTEENLSEHCWDLPQRKSKRQKIISSNQGPSSRVIDFVNTAIEITATKRIPKLFGHSLTQADVDRELVSRITNGIHEYPERRLVVKVLDLRKDPHSLLLVARGHPELVEQVKEKVAVLINRYQSNSFQNQVESMQSTGEHQCTEAKPSKVQGEEIVRTTELKKSKKRQLKDTLAQSQLVRPTDKKDTVESEASTAYRAFQDKYKEIREIEYQGYVHLQTVNKSMWTRHRLIYGQKCDDDCTCVLIVDQITAAVIRDFLSAKLKDDPNWSNPHDLREGDSPVGFTNRFAPRFTQLLQKEYPSESPKQILERLLLMWTEHRKTQRFGIGCKPNCPCAEGWDFVFKRGRLGLDKKSLEPASLGKKVSEARAVPRSGFASIPRMTNKSDQGKLLVDNSVSPMSIKRKPDIGAIAVNSLKASKSQRKTYEVIFDAQVPMGFYCVTEKKDGVSLCKITSLSAAGRRKDSRLEVGTVIKDAGIFGERLTYPIHTVGDIKRLYQNAKHKKEKLRVRFINTDVSSSSLLSMIPLAGGVKGNRNNGWSNSGSWLGSSTKGWAGGALSVTSKRTADDASIARSQPQRDSAVLEAGQTDALTLKQDTSQFPLDEHVTASAETLPNLLLNFNSEMKPAGHRSLPKPNSLVRKSKYSPDDLGQSVMTPGTSLLKALTRGSSITRKSVKFVDKDKFEERYYERGSVSVAFATDESGGSAPSPSATDSSTAISLLDTDQVGVYSTSDLIEAIRDKTYVEVMRVLQSGVSAVTPDERNTTPKTHNQARLDALKSDLEKDPANKETLALKRDAELKRKLLYLFIQSEYVIENARFFKKWVHLDIKIEKIKNLRLTGRALDQNGSPAVSCRVEVARMQQQSMPLVPLSDTIAWNGNEDHGYFADYNPCVEDDSFHGIKNFSVDIERLDRISDSIPPILLGRLEISLKRMLEVADSGVGVIEEDLEPNEYVASGTMVLDIRKSRPPTEFLSKKNKDLRKMLHENAIKWISRFNMETTGDGHSGPKLTGHIAPAKCDHISLLHAAIYLDDPLLVRKLLDLGANPTATSGVGPATRLARNLAERGGYAGEIIQILSGSGFDITSDSHTPPSAGPLSVTTEQTKNVDTYRTYQQPENVEGISPEHDLQNSKRIAVHEQNFDVNEIKGRNTNSEGILIGDESVKEYGDNKGSSIGMDLQMPSEPAMPGSRSSQGHVQTELNPTCDESRPTSSHQTENSLDLPSLTYEKSMHNSEGILVGEQSIKVDGDSKGSSVGMGLQVPSEAAMPGSRSLQGHVQTQLNPTISHQTENRRDLPSLTYKEWTRPGVPLCRFFNRLSGCDRGKGCKFVHAREPLGRRLVDCQQDGNAVHFHTDCVSLTRRHDDVGQLCVTAAYTDPQDGVTYYAEGGSTLGQNDQGICWYRTETDAIAALKSVKLCWQQIKGGNSGKSVPPRQPRAVLNTPQVKSSILNQNEAVYHRLLRSNLSNIFIQIFQTHLRKTDWVVHDGDSGLVAAELHYPRKIARKPGMPTVCKSWEMKGGVVKNDIGWHVDILHAKASAFYYLLEAAAAHGLCMNDLMHTHDGQPIVFKK